MSIMDEYKRQSVLRMAGPVPAFTNPLVQQIPPVGSAASASHSGTSRPLVQAINRPAVTPNPSASPLAQMDPTSPARRDPANPMQPKQGASAALAAPASGAQQVRPGIYRQGNSFSDTAEGAAAGARPAPISAQNMAAADQLAARYATQNPLVQAAQPQQPVNQNMTPADTGQGYGYGLLNSNRIAVRNAMVDAGQFKPGAGRALAALLQQQGDAPKLAMEREQMAQRGQESAADRLMRGQELSARLGESAADRALKSQELADNALVNAAKREAMGVETGAAKRLASLQDAVLNAETEADRSTAAQRLAQFKGLTGSAPAAPAGFRWSANGQSLEAIPGGPAAIKQTEDQRTRDSAHDQTRQTIGTINRLMEHPGRKGATGTWNLGRMVPGTDAADFAAEVETLKAQTFLPMVQQLRGMGALSNAEGDKLNAAVGALRFDMSEKAFNESLGRIRDQFGSALGRAGIDTKDMQSWGMNPNQGQQATPQPQQSPQRAVKRTGTLNGRKVVEYADGSINYAD